jgi:amino acid transporter
LEYIFKKPDYLITCVFGITFIVFGNLAGNAIQLGIYMQSVLDPKCQDDCVKSGPVVAWAIGALTLCALFNVGTRKFSIYLNNTFAVLKISLIIVMIFIGVGYGSTHGNGCQQIVWENKGEGRPSVGNVITALFYAMYPYTGYEQPFYVLAEVEKPKTKFSQTVLWTMGFFIGLYTLINTSYLCMNPYTGNDGSRTNAAINFFYKLSSGNESGNERAKHATVQGVSFVVALFIFGNLLAQTYTASRVKQEIAKEGILPYSLWFAKSHDTLWALWCRRGHGQENTDAAVVADANAGPNRDREGEQAPFAATLLHLGFEVLLVLLVGLSLRPNTAYNFLTYIYTYVIVSLLGFLTVCGLAYLKYDAWRWPRPEVPGSASATPADGSASATPADGSASTTPADGSASTTPAEQKRKGRGWNSKWKPWLDPWPCVVAVVALGVLLFGAFAKPSRPSKDDDLQWWVKPLVGLLCLLAGVAWWVGLEAWQRMGHFRLVRRRTMHVDASDPDDNDPVLLAELVVIEKKKLAATQRQFGS